MISVVIPAYNEEEAIVDTLTVLKQTLNEVGGENYEIIVVNDGSTDRTGELAEGCGAKVIHLPHNIGYGRSLKSGINAADHDTIMIMDADGTYPVSEIGILLEEFRKGFDMVVAQRTGKYFRGSAIKGPFRLILKWLVEFSADRKVPDVNSGMRVFRRGDAIKFFNHLCDTFSFTTSLTLAYMMNGMFVGYVPIKYQERIGRTKVRFLRDSFRTMLYILQAILYYNPIKIFLVLSGVTLGFSVVCFIFVFTLQIKTAFYLGVGSILVTFIIFSLGLIADLLRKIMDFQRHSEDPWTLGR